MTRLSSCSSIMVKWEIMNYEHVKTNHEPQHAELPLNATGGTLHQPQHPTSFAACAAIPSQLQEMIRVSGAAAANSSSSSSAGNNAGSGEYRKADAKGPAQTSPNPTRPKTATAQRPPTASSVHGLSNGSTTRPNRRLQQSPRILSSTNDGVTQNLPENRSALPARRLGHRRHRIFSNPLAYPGPTTIKPTT